MKLLASENGFVHVCGHRGHSVGAPENTMAAFRATKENGGTTCEIDIVLTRDGEIAVIHDLAVDRVSDGHGLVAGLTMAELAKLDAGSWFDPAFAGERIPSLREVLLYAKGHLGLVIEIKERFQFDPLVDRLGELLEETGTHDDVIIISFDHPALLEVKRRIPGVRTEGITHARHVSMPAVAQSANLDSLSIELARFHPEDARELHEAGVAIRCHLPRPPVIGYYDALGAEMAEEMGAYTASLFPSITERVGEWLREGLIDSLSGDDVVWLHKFVSQNPLG
ncbi:MAG: hypothetical protein JSV66_03010 [Trueperaceae bacterium]|nr:MAG: hypothetical protein JSV66_03010 [Trueperaceae bacterium]